MMSVRRSIGRLALAVLLLGALAVALAPASHAGEKKPKKPKADKAAKAAAKAATPWWKVQDFWAHWLLYGGTDPAPAAPKNYGQVRSEYAKRGGNRGSSNPTTVPIVDGDLNIAPGSWDDILGLEQAHAVTRGAGQVVVVLDGGFQLDHPAIAHAISFLRYDAVDEDDDPQAYPDWYDGDGDGEVDEGLGHGTFVIGKILEIAPEARIVPVRIRDDEGWGTDLELIRGLEYARSIGADVVNISGVSPRGHTAHVTQLLRELRDFGTLVVVSAGNDGVDGVSDLGDGNLALTVGAVGEGDVLAEFSNYTWDAGRAVVYAPGVDLQGPYGFPTVDSYATWSGTSFSTAFVAGAAALVRSFEPWLRPQDVMDRLQWTAETVRSPEGWILPQGRIHVGRAVLP